MSKEYVFITGATGFIGSHVTEKLLLENRYYVVAILREIRNYKNVMDLGHKGVALVKGSFYDKNLLEKIFEKYPVQSVIHIAALRGGGAGTKEEYYNVNVLGTEILLETSLKYQVRKFIFCSSVGVFGTIPRELPANLKTELNGDNEYHNSKILAERKVEKFINKGLDAFIVRPAITYGKGDNGFPAILVKLVKKRMLLLPANDNKIHLLDASDLADLFIRILKANKLFHKVFIAADEAPISLSKLVDLIHFHYYKRNYPSFLRLPDSIFKIVSMIFQMSRNEKWLTRILLISKSWHYDISKTLNAFQYIPARTRDAFIKRMHI